MAKGLADLFKSSVSGINFRVDRVVSWNSTTGANTITVGATTITDAPILLTTALPSLAALDAVGLLWTGNQYVILGKIDTPPI